MRRPRKMGHFRFDAEIFDDEKTARAIYRDMIVYRVENNMATNIVDVWAVHPEFHDTEPHMQCWEYCAVFTKDRDGNVTATWKS